MKYKIFTKYFQMAGITQEKLKIALFPEWSLKKKNKKKNKNIYINKNKKIK